jgi:hypothetical protein
LVPIPSIWLSLVFTIVESYGDSPAPIGHVASISVSTSEMATTEVSQAE